MIPQTQVTKVQPNFADQDEVLFGNDSRAKLIQEGVTGLLNEPAAGASKEPPADNQANIPPISDEITAEFLLNRRVESIPCLIEPIFQAIGLTAVAGSSDVGKSAFLRQLAVAVATGQNDFLGWKIKAKHNSAIYVSTEDDESATAFLLNSLNKNQRKNPSQFKGLRFVFDTTNLLAELDKRLERAPADLVVIDAFGDLFNGDSSSSNQIRKFLHDYSQLAQKHNCLFLWLHHTGKRTDDLPPSKHNLIGGQGFEGKMRLVIELRRDWFDQGKRHLCIVKGNYLPDEYKDSSYVLTWGNFAFSPTDERVPFEQLGRPKDPDAAGNAKYEEIQLARAKNLKGDALAAHLNMSKGYISKIEAKYGPKNLDKAEVS